MACATKPTSDPKLRLDDLDRDGVYASVIYGPNLFGLPIADQELKAWIGVAVQPGNTIRPE